jgi:hypothetical protein
MKEVEGFLEQPFLQVKIYIKILGGKLLHGFMRKEET